MSNEQNIAKFSQSRNDMYWKFWADADGTIMWTGYDDSYWWDNVSKSDVFLVKRGAKTGRLFKLCPETNTVTISEVTEQKS
jgi:hypothetical protein